MESRSPSSPARQPPAPAGPSSDCPKAAPLAIQVGVFRAEKNQAGALEAFAKVRERLPEAQLAFIGDGPEREAVERRAAELGAGEWAHFLGMRADAAALTGLADIQLLPSIADAMPMTTLEAMALGVPVLATDVGDVRRTLGEAGSIVAAGDVDAFAEECLRLLSDPEARRRMGDAGRDRAQLFDSAAMVRRFEALYTAARSGSAPIPAVEAAG